LRQLVEAGFPQERAEPRHPRIIAQLMVPGPLRPRVRVAREQRSQPLLGVDRHAAELQATKGSAVLADPPVSEQDRPAILHEYGHGHGDHHRKQKCERNQRNHKVHERGQCLFRRAILDGPERARHRRLIVCEFGHLIFFGSKLTKPSSPRPVDQLTATVHGSARKPEIYQMWRNCFT